MSLFLPDPFDGLSLLGSEARDLHNEMARYVGYFKELHESIEAKLLEPPQVATVPEEISFPVLLTFGLDPPPFEFSANRWEYAWREAALDAGNEWVEKPNGRSWIGGEAPQPARNWVEVGNTAFFAQHGIALDQTGGNPAISLTVEPLPDGTVVELTRVSPLEGPNRLWFTAYNELKVFCSAPPSPILPPPPTIVPGVLA